MRATPERNRLANAKAEKRSTEASCSKSLATVAMISPAAARAAGLPVSKRFRANHEISTNAAVGIARVALAGSIRMVVERQHTFSHMAEATASNNVLLAASGHATDGFSDRLRSA